MNEKDECELLQDEPTILPYAPDKPRPFHRVLCEVKYDFQAGERIYIEINKKTGLWSSPDLRVIDYFGTPPPPVLKNLSELGL